MITMSKICPFGSNWEDVKKEIFTPEEIEASKIRVALMGELVKARQEKGITQRQLEEMTGIKQPVIARIESGRSVPKIDTLQKVLLALGKTLAITDVAPSKTKTPLSERSR